MFVYLFSKYARNVRFTTSALFLPPLAPRPRKLIITAKHLTPWTLTRPESERVYGRPTTIHPLRRHPPGTSQTHGTRSPHGSPALSNPQGQNPIPIRKRYPHDTSTRCQSDHHEKPHPPRGRRNQNTGHCPPSLWRPPLLAIHRRRHPASTRDCRAPAGRPARSKSSSR